MQIGIIDYGAGNLQSVRNALETLGTTPKIIADPSAMDGIDVLIFPGVGHFGDSMRNLNARGLSDPIRTWVAADKPILAICVGYQVLFESSEESPDEPGLGIFKGKVVRFPSESGLKVPHMGWNQLRCEQEGDPLWRDQPVEPFFYFVHSYYPVPEDHSLISATADYGGSFAAAIRLGNLAATQFHPEKSQENGVRLLKNFLETH